MKDNRPHDDCHEERDNPFESCKFERDSERTEHDNYELDHQEHEERWERDTPADRCTEREAFKAHKGPTHTAAGTPLEEPHYTYDKPSKAKLIVLAVFVILVFAIYKVTQHMFAVHNNAVQLQEQITKVFQQDQSNNQVDTQTLEQAIDKYAENYSQNIADTILGKVLPLENLSQLTVLSDLQYLTSLTYLAEYYSDYGLTELHRRIYQLERLHKKLPEMREVTTRLYNDIGQNYNWLTKFASSLVGQAINVESKDAFPYLIDQLDCFYNITDPKLVEDSVQAAFDKGTFLVGNTHDQWILQNRKEPRAIQFDIGDQKFYGILYEAHQSASAHYDIALEHDKDDLYPPEFKDYLTHKLTKSEVRLEFRLTCPQHPPVPAKS